MWRIIGGAILWLYAIIIYAWNMQGHQVIAQIAYDNLTPAAKQMCSNYLGSSSKSLNKQFLTASTWMDRIKFKKNHEYDTLHYIDIPYSISKINLPAISPFNVVWAINNAVTILSGKEMDREEQNLALLILIHLVADIHQPLHTITRVSKRQPIGDLGGNLFLLGANPIASNLHRYWDNGAGLFSGTNKRRNIKKTARLLENKSLCPNDQKSMKPEIWAQDSHQLAIEQVYQLGFREVPTRQYQANAQVVIEKQTLLAGCRLAALLNKIAS